MTGRPICLLFTLVAAPLLGGCGASLMATPNLYAGGGIDPWRDTPAALRTPEVPVIYATDRLRESDPPNPTYGHKRNRSLAFGICRVAIGPEHSWEDLSKRSLEPVRLLPISIRKTTTEELGAFPETPGLAQVEETWHWKEDHDARNAEAAAQLQELIARQMALTPRKEAFVYIHGFNNYFDDSVKVVAELWHFMGREGVPLVYTWPAGAGLNMRGYNYDRESGEFTIYHLKRYLEAVASTPGLTKLHILAHSRGTEVVVSALRELHIGETARAGGARDATRRVLKLGNVILAAPDIDLDVAMQRLVSERVDEACERLTVYTSPDDLAIGFAKWLFGSAVRIGSMGLIDLQELPELARVPRIDLVDARVTSDLVGHAYFYTNPAASSDLLMLLRYNRAPGEQNGRPLTRRANLFWEFRDQYCPDPSRRPAATQPAATQPVVMRPAAEAALR